jgi:hypothetical protein
MSLLRGGAYIEEPSWAVTLPSRGKNYYLRKRTRYCIGGVFLKRTFCWMVSQRIKGAKFAYIVLWVVARK